MRQFGSFLLVPMLSILLITAQTLWASSIKATKPFEKSTQEMVSTLIMSPKIWLGGTLYAGATILYFLLLSKYRFFSIQIGMTALAIFLSTTVSILLFHEKASSLNLIGMVLVLTGAYCVFK